MTALPDQSNPARRMAEEFAGQMAQTREDLLRLSNLHPDFVQAGFAAIDASRARLNRPTLGEVFPHLVARGLTLNDRDRRVVAAAWLAMFGYILLVDHELDQKGYLDGRASIAGSALLSWGVATNARYVASTRYADAYFDNVNRAFSGQYDDIRLRGDMKADRTASDADKNRAFVAAIAAFCAAAGETDDRLIRSAEAMLGPFQVLDDLEDIEEDLKEENVTSFVRIVRERVSAAGPLTRTQAYRAIIADSRTIATLRRAGDGAEKAILLLDPHRDGALIQYLCELRDCNAALIRALEDYQRDPSPIKEPEVMRRIEQIASGCG